MRQAQVHSQLMTDSAQKLEQRQLQLQAEENVQQAAVSRRNAQNASSHRQAVLPPVPQLLPMLPGQTAAAHVTSPPPSDAAYADWGGVAFTVTKKPQLPKVKIPIPCWVGCTPCGEVAYEDTVYHPFFGNIYVPKRENMKAAQTALRATFAMVMLVVGIIIGLYVVFEIGHPGSREDIRDLFDKLYPRVDDPYTKYVDYQESIDERYRDVPIFSKDDWTDNCNDCLTPNSQSFIAPGNIYRVLAVLTPDHGVSTFVWARWASQATIVAYMQFSVPMQILAHDLTKWECTGVKTPLWFVYNPMVMSAFASLFSLFHAFAGKCVCSISDGARANYFIIANFCQPDDQYRLLSKLACCFSLFMNVMSSMLLQACMFVKVSTYSGDMGDAALCAIALYFVFDLDDKVMQANPGLRDRYRRAVIKEIRKSMADRDADGRTKTRGEQPQWLLYAGGIMCVFVSALTPIYLYLIFFLAWRNPKTGQEIGGDPF